MSFTMEGVAKEPAASLHSLPHLHLRPFHHHHHRQHQPHHRRNFLQVDSRSGKRRRSSSPFEERFLLSKRPLLNQQQISAPLRVTKDARHPELCDHREAFSRTPSISPLNQQAGRLELENSSTADIEMDVYLKAAAREDEKGEEQVEEMDSALLFQMSSNPTFPLPLHRPHPVAYQQHMALSLSNQTRKALASNTHIINHIVTVKKDSEDLRKKINCHAAHT
ncbi:hypothetical protein O181_068304 [Austropuccinia psidii MF-1]|uniref:Uncharacterized protein n=1 Tax=Austropuccinia psidii MF-1 TaxID=1389203 RepID=A0A9Q3EX10_9BASI|nr:hypothetical protein [Austropuccinia psidii MF-1]